MPKYIVLLTLLLSVKVLAVEDIFTFQNEEQRASYIRLSEELRCPKCQNQNLSDSNSEIADIMREVIAEELNNGKTEHDIKSLMVDRYGEFVLYEPPRTLETAVLWWAPIAFLGFAAFTFIFIVFKRSRVANQNDDEQPE